MYEETPTYRMYIYDQNGARKMHKRKCAKIKKMGEKSRDYIVLSKDFIKETLSIYRDEHIYIKSAKVKKDQLIGLLCLPDYYATKNGIIDYMTASSMMTVISQVGYIYLRCMCRRHIYDLIIDEFTDEVFKKNRDAGDIVMHQLNCKFSRKIKSREISYTMRGYKVAVRRNFMFASFYVDLQNASASITGVMCLPID